VSRYSLHGRPIASVTEIIAEILGVEFRAEQYFLDRGTAVHASAALIAKGVDFDFDPQIAGQVAACRKFFEVYQPEVLEVETPKIHQLYQYAGTIDLIVKLNNRKVIIDWKASIPKTINIQLGGYGELHSINRGMPVMLGADGTFKAGEIVDLRIPRREFLACRSVYGIREKLGLLERENRND